MPGDGPRAARASRPRLRRSHDIQRVLRDGLSLRSGRVVLYVAPGAGPARAACVAGRRVGKAVVRNRAKRLLRAAWREVAPLVSEGLDIVLMGRPGIRGARGTEVRVEVEELLRRAGAIG